MSAKLRDLADVYHDQSWGHFRMAIADPNKAATNYALLLGTISSTEADRLWGRVLVSAVAYKTARVRREISRYWTGKNAERIGARNDDPPFVMEQAKLRMELTIRRSGRIASHVHYTFTKSDREIQHDWRDQGYLEPFNSTTVIAMEHTWTALGWMVTRLLPPAQLQAELAMHMISQMAAG